MKRTFAHSLPERWPRHENTQPCQCSYSFFLGWIVLYIISIFVCCIAFQRWIIGQTNSSDGRVLRLVMKLMNGLEFWALSSRFWKLYFRWVHGMERLGQTDLAGRPKMPFLYLRAL